MLSIRRALPVIGFGLSAIGWTAGALGQSAATTEPTPREMMEQIRQLQAKVADLEARQAKSAPVATAANGVATATPAPSGNPAPASVSAAVEADADRHSHFFDISNPLTGGYDNGFVLRSEDGAFSFHPSVLVDVRNDTSYRERIPAKGGGTDTPNATGYDTQNGFDLTRLRLTFDGTFARNFTYFFQFAADQGASLGVLDAYATYHFSQTPLSVKAGQFKDPVWHERNLSEGVLMAVDRTYLESVLGGGQTSRVQGASLMYDKGRVRAQAVIHDGFDSINTRFYDAGGIGAGIGGGAGVTPTDFGTSGRAELLLIGSRTKAFNPFSEYEQFTSLGARQDILVLGGGFDYSQANSNDVLFHTVDLQYNNTNGLSAYAAYLGSDRDIHTNQGVARPGVYYDAGFMVQVAYVLPQTHFEPFGRFDFTHLAPHSVTGLATTDTQELTVGANYYLDGQHAKLTVDGTWLPNGAPADADGLAILRDSGHTEWLLRGQLQLWL